MMVEQIRFINGASGGGGGCDESKCVSKGGSNLFDGSFTCHADDGALYPMMCADGFIPMAVEDEFPFIATERSEFSDVSLRYFTCCPPHELSFKANQATRECSDPITFEFDAEKTNTDAICDEQGSRKYPRRMKSSADNTETISFICCDSQLAVEDDIEDIENNTASFTTANFLEDTECVPYRNELYESSKVENQIARIPVISCNFPDEDFAVPRPVDNASTGQYQCCKTGPALPPFIQDSTFNTTIYPVLALFCIAAILSLIVVVGLLVPLLAKGMYRRATASRNTSIRTSRNMSRRNSVSSQVTRGEPRYSTYNLYLVYLAVFDLAYCSIQIALFANTIDQKFYPGFYGPLVFSPTKDHFPLKAELQTVYVGSNLWMNAIISYQILKLLRTSKRLKRIKQPKLRTVFLQAGAAFLISALIGYSLSILDHSIRVAHGDNPEREEMIRILFFVLLALLYVPPIGYVIYVACMIRCRSYIPSEVGTSSTNGRMRELAYYFFRIVIVFFGVWFPALMFTGYGNSTGKSIGILISYYLEGIQPILTFCMILTKSDAKKYILDLVTLSYFRKKYQRSDTLPPLSTHRSIEMQGSSEEPSSLLSMQKMSPKQGKPAERSSPFWAASKDDARDSGALAIVVPPTVEAETDDDDLEELETDDGDLEELILDIESVDDHDIKADQFEC